MQLVEQGKLDLDGDVNSYLKTFKIPDKYGKPIRIRDLMTHSAGWEDGALGYLIIEDSSKVEPIATTLQKHMPTRVRPPGALSSYSNYGAALAGLIVEQVSGVPFNDYIRRNILEPLDMKYATFDEPPPPDIRPYSVVGYAYENGVYVPKPFEYVGGFRPAGSGSFSALSMTHFMIAHLQDGQYGSARILKPETAELMHKRAFANDPRLPGMALGFYEQEFNGTRVIGHAGDTQHMHTELYLVPEAQVGIFASYVGDGGGPAREGLMRAFFDRYFPAKVAAAPPAAPADFSTMAKNYVGDYRFARHSSTKLEKAPPGRRATDQGRGPRQGQAAARHWSRREAGAIRTRRKRRLRAGGGAQAHHLLWRLDRRREAHGDRGSAVHGHGARAIHGNSGTLVHGARALHAHLPRRIAHGLLSPQNQSRAAGRPEARPQARSAHRCVVLSHLHRDRRGARGECEHALLAAFPDH